MSITYYTDIIDVINYVIQKVNPSGKELAKILDSIKPGKDFETRLQKFYDDAMKLA